MTIGACWMATRKTKIFHIQLLPDSAVPVQLDLCDEIVLLSHGTLEAVDKNDLEEDAFKEKIIAALREEDQ